MGKMKLLEVTVMKTFLPFCRLLFRELQRALTEKIGESLDKVSTMVLAWGEE